jgi:hypothetical protein
MESFEKMSNRCRNLLIILVVLCYTFIHTLQQYIVSEQLNYTKTKMVLCYFYASFY